MIPAAVPPGPCMAMLPGTGTTVLCDLRAGHAGGHESGMTSWLEQHPMTPDDFDWRAEGQASSRALGWALLLVAVLTVVALIGAVLALVVGILRADSGVLGALFIGAAIAALLAQVRGVVHDELARRRERVQP